MTDILEPSNDSALAQLRVAWPELTAVDRALAVALALALSPVGAWFGFQLPSPPILAAMTGLVALYLVCAELLKPFATASVSLPAGRRRRPA